MSRSWWASSGRTASSLPVFSAILLKVSSLSKFLGEKSATTSPLSPSQISRQFR